MCADALEHVAQIFEWIDVEALARRRDVRHDCSRPAAVVTAQEGAIAPSDCDSA